MVRSKQQLLHDDTKEHLRLFPNNLQHLSRRTRSEDLLTTNMNMCKFADRNDDGYKKFNYAMNIFMEQISEWNQRRVARAPEYAQLYATAAPPSGRGRGQAPSSRYADSFFRHLDTFLTATTPLAVIQVKLAPPSRRPKWPLQILNTLIPLQRPRPWPW